MTSLRPTISANDVFNPVQMINDRKDFTGIIQPNTLLEKYEFRRGITDTQVQNEFGVAPTSQPKLYFFSPSYMNLNGGCMNLNVFAHTNIASDIQGYLNPTFGDKIGSYTTFFLDFTELRIIGTGDTAYRNARFVYNGRRDNFVSDARVYGDRLEIDCNFGLADLAICKLYFSDGTDRELVFNRDNISRIPTGLSIPVGSGLINDSGLTIKGWMLYG